MADSTLASRTGVPAVAPTGAPTRARRRTPAAEPSASLAGHPPLRHLLEAGGIVVGIDPGQSTGVVAVHFPASLEWNEARYVAGGVDAVSNRAALWGPRRDHDLGQRIHARLLALPETPTHIALEEPRDGSMQWRGYQRQQSVTAFRLGAYYGQAVTAAMRTGAIEVASYPVTTARGSVGWMGGRSHRAVLEETQALARVLGVDGRRWPDHQWMALGVIAHHVRVVLALRLALRMARLARRPGA